MSRAVEPVKNVLSPKRREDAAVVVVERELGVAASRK